MSAPTVAVGHVDLSEQLLADARRAEDAFRNPRSPIGARTGMRSRMTMNVEALIDGAKTAYVAGRIALDEFERQLDRLIAYEDAVPTGDAPAFVPPAWLVDDFKRSFDTARNSGRTTALADGPPFIPFSNDAAPTGVITLP